MRNFSDALFEGIAGYGANLDFDFWYDLFDEDAPAAMYAAREIVYSLVEDAETAQELSDWGADLEPEEQDALDSLIADALEGANEHEAMMDYYHDRGLKILIADQVDAKNKNLIDNELAKASDDDKHQLLFNAINSLVLNGYLYEAVKGKTKGNKLTETSGRIDEPKKDINQAQKEIRDDISNGYYNTAASDIFEYGIIDAYGNEWWGFQYGIDRTKIEGSNITLSQVFNDHPDFKALVESNAGKLVLEAVANGNKNQYDAYVFLQISIYNALTTKSQALGEVDNTLKAEQKKFERPAKKAPEIYTKQEWLDHFFGPKSARLDLEDPEFKGLKGEQIYDKLMAEYKKTGKPDTLLVKF